MPAGWGLAIGFALIYLGQGYYADQIFDEVDSAPRSLVSVAIQFLSISALLRFRRLDNRLPQTITALAATGFLFGALSIVLITQAVPGEPHPVLALTWFALFLWSLAVDAHIYRRAMSITMSLGVLVAVLIFALNFIVIQALFPAAA